MNLSSLSIMRRAFGPGRAVLIFGVTRVLVAMGVLLKRFLNPVFGRRCRKDGLHPASFCSLRRGTSRCRRGWDALAKATQPGAAAGKPDTAASTWTCANWSSESACLLTYCTRNRASAEPPKCGIPANFASAMRVRASDILISNSHHDRSPAPAPISRPTELRIGVSVLGVHVSRDQHCGAADSARPDVCDAVSDRRRPHARFLQT